jgi:hypothetical protein
MVLHHIDDTAALFARVHTLLKPNGRIAFADLYKEDGSFHENPEGVHHTGFDPAALTTLLEQTGFHTVRFETAFTFQKAKPYPVFLLTAQKA